MLTKENRKHGTLVRLAFPLNVWNYGSWYFTDGTHVSRQELNNEVGEILDPEGIAQGSPYEGVLVWFPCVNRFAIFCAKDLDTIK